MKQLEEPAFPNCSLISMGAALFLSLKDTGVEYGLF